MADFSNAKVGDKVMDKALFGDKVGKIVEVWDTGLQVNFPDNIAVNYFTAGNIFRDAIPTLRYLCPDGTLSETRPEPKKVVNWAKVAERVRNHEDVKVYVRHDDNGSVNYNRYFVGCRLGKFEVYADGKTGFTTGHTEFWPFCKLAEPDKFQDCMEEKK